MAGQWPDPNGKWFRRMSRWTLPIGIVDAALMASFLLGKIAGWDQLAGTSWAMIVIDAVMALNLVVIGMVLRLQTRQSRP